MQVALAGTDSRDGALLASAKKTLESHGVHPRLMKEHNDLLTPREVDVVLVAGGDRGMLDYFHRVDAASAPVLGIYESDATGFLSQIELRELPSAILKLKQRDFSVDEVARLAVKVDDREIEPALNDVAVFPSKSATLMEYVLRIDGSDVWHDNSDGVIISTPAGSTAYSMSAGGPMVLQKASVFLAVSVNSLDNTRRPLVVSNESSVEVTGITSRYHCEVVLDGGRRTRIRKRMECTRHEFPARLVRLANHSAPTVMAKKVHLAEDMLKMPPSAKLILKTLEYEGALGQRDLALKTMLPERTIRLSLSHLLKEGIVKRKTSLRDARQKIYQLV